MLLGAPVERGVRRHVCAPTLQLGVRTAARVPDAQNLDLFVADTVVQEVMYPSEMQALHPRSTCIRNRHTDAWLDAQKRKSLREFLIEGFWGELAVVVPPPSGAVNLRLRSLRDPDSHGLASHDDAQASRALPPLIPFHRDLLPRSREEALLPLPA
jgi:hypothetical protein